MLRGYIVPAKIFDQRRSAFLVLFADGNDGNGTRRDKQRQCRSHGAGCFGGTVPAHGHDIADILRHFCGREKHGPARIDKGLFDDVGVRLVDHAFRPTDPREIEEPAPRGHGGGGITGFVPPHRRRANFFGQFLRWLCADPDLVARYGGVKDGLRLGGEGLGILDETVDELAGHRHPEAVARIGEKVPRIGAGVKTLKMGAEAPRELARQIDRALARAAAACCGQDRFDRHHILHPKGPFGPIYRHIARGKRRIFDMDHNRPAERTHQSGRETARKLYILVAINGDRRVPQL